VRRLTIQHANRDVARFCAIEWVIGWAEQTISGASTPKYGFNSVSPAVNSSALYEARLLPEAQRRAPI
jgi:hypothetical protein